MYKEIIRLTLRIDSNTHNKLLKICETSKRSLNGQIDYIITSFIKEYEKFNGEIKIRDQ
jgi:hypothetical protein